jgi:CysZ protein
MMIKSSGTGFPAFALGAVSPFRSLKTVIHVKGLRRYFVIPFILNVFILAAVVYFTFFTVYPYVAGIVPGGGAWYIEIVRVAVAALAIILLAALCMFLYSITGTIITAPFNDPLSARFERLRTGGHPVNEPMTIRAALSDMARVVVNTAKLLVIFGGVNLLFMLLHLIPAVGTMAYTALSFASALFFIGFGFFDFPLDRKRMGFGEKLRLLWKFRWMTMGLGMGFFLVSLVPVVGFLGMNLCTIAATELYMDDMSANRDRA